MSVFPRDGFATGKYFHRQKQAALPLPPAASDQGWFKGSGGLPTEGQNGREPTGPPSSDTYRCGHAGLITWVDRVGLVGHDLPQEVWDGDLCC